MLTAESLARVVAYNLLSVSKVGGMRSRPTVEDYVAFKKLMYPQYVHAPHLQAVDEILMDVLWYIESGGVCGIEKAIICMPPRHGKTQNVSKLFPMYVLARNPHLLVMLTSYGATLARTNSRWIRNLMLTDEFVKRYPMARLAGDSKEARKFHTIKDGGVNALGIDGSATGHGAMLFVGDDFIKNRKQAESPVYRDNIWHSWLNDFVTRLEPGAGTILQMTRWHVDDIIGRILTYEPDEWKVLILPAIAKENDPLGRKVGEALWAERYPIKKLLERKKQLGEYAFASLYQQEPIPSEGGLFKREWFYPSPKDAPVIKRVVRYWDLAMSATASADYTVGVKLGEGVDGNFYVMDVARVKRDWSDVVPFIKRVILADGKAVRQGLEKKAYMSRAVSDLNKDRELHGYAIEGYGVDTDKFTRALPVSAKFGAGLIKVMDAVWTTDFIDELCAFPRAGHDDQVDALAGAWSMMDESNTMKPLGVKVSKYV
ncbi:MAG: phage terminase large subunit [bacterium]|nr:phage terminase large subunit [bacterium]